MLPYKLDQNLRVSLRFVLFIFTRVSNFAFCNVALWRAFLGGVNDRKGDRFIAAEKGLAVGERVLPLAGFGCSGSCFC